MKSPRKRYVVAPLTSEIVPTIDDMLVRFANKSDPPQIFDFNTFDGSPRMARQLALGFRQNYSAAAPGTRHSVFYSLRTWASWSAQLPVALESLDDVSNETIALYISWLKDTKKTSTGYHAWTGIKQILKWYMTFRPDLLDPLLEIPFNPFPKKNALTEQRKYLDSVDIDKILSAAHLDIERHWKTFLIGQDAIKSARSRGSTPLQITRKCDLGETLCWIIDYNDGIVPSYESCLGGNHTLYQKLKDLGGLTVVRSYLYPSSDILFPFAVAIGINTFANADSLRLFQHDCLSDHELLESRAVVSWRKGRSTRIQRRSFLRKKRLSVPDLIGKVQAMTAGIRIHLEKPHSDKLFIVGPDREYDFPRAIADWTLRRLPKIFVDRHKLVDEMGNTLEFTLSMLRPSGLIRAHTELGGDILLTQALANHADPDTTQRYVDTPGVRRAHEMELASIQLRFVEVARGTMSQTETPSSHVAVENATASGFICTDPLAGIAPGERAGTLCKAWLGCFTCPNAVIPLSVEIASRLLATRDALLQSRSTMVPDRWEALYAPKLKVLERDILPRFPDDVLAAAALIEKPILPPIE